MDGQLFILLVVVGAFVIGIIYFDAKRRSKVRREKVEREVYQQAPQSEDEDFDLDGVSKVRVVSGRSNGQDKVDNSEVPVPNVSIDDFPEPVSAAVKQVKERLSADSQASAKSTAQVVDPIVDEPLEPLVDETSVPVLDDAIFSFNKDDLKQEPVIEQPQQTSLFDEKEEQQIEVEPELIFSLFIVANQDRPFQGAVLVQALLEQGLRHGDMNIFHRHSQSTGRGPIQFSLANAFDPGTFDLNDLDNLSTNGLAVFMALPGPKKPKNAYELMVKTAKAIAENLGGFVLDSSKSNFSKQIEAHHLTQIQEFERKLLLTKR